MTDELGGICLSKNMRCPYAKEDGHCALNVTEYAKNGKQTVADKIRHMTDEELANVFILYCDLCIYGDDEDCNDKDCEQGVLAGLRSEAK